MGLRLGWSLSRGSSRRFVVGCGACLCVSSLFLSLLLLNISLLLHFSLSFSLPFILIYFILSFSYISSLPRPPLSLSFSPFYLFFLSFPLPSTYRPSLYIYHFFLCICLSMSLSFYALLLKFSFPLSHSIRNTSVALNSA